jgi:peroxiredoxin
MPQYELLSEQERAVAFVGVNTEDSEGHARAFVKDFQIDFPIVFDEPGEVAIRLGNLPVAGLPFTVLVDKAGRIAAVYEGRQTVADLEASLHMLSRE